jgi:hypothetical protein
MSGGQHVRQRALLKVLFIIKTKLTTKHETKTKAQKKKNKQTNKQTIQNTKYKIQKTEKPKPTCNRKLAQYIFLNLASVDAR